MSHSDTIVATILRDIMGEDQLQRLFKTGPSESLLFQLEMEMGKIKIPTLWSSITAHRVRVPSGNVSRTSFPLQNVPQMLKQM